MDDVKMAETVNVFDCFQVVDAKTITVQPVKNL